ncbi:MAG: glycosyltransferase family 4 protein [Candidatus Krumholzibacteriota bacterium]|nr:glycosyltransferase family 4 protein [Candidatus Krumholzibacteriota bacterium]
MTEAGPISISYFSDAPYTGGAEKYLHLLASHLDRDHFAPSLIIYGSTGLRRLESWMREDRIPVYEIPAPSLYSPAAAASLKRLLARLKPDILHLNLPGPFDARYSLVAPLARLSGVRHIVSTEHLPMVPSFLKSRILKGFASRSIDTIVTVSQDNQNHLVKNHGIDPAKIRVIHNGIPDPGKVEKLDLKSGTRHRGDTFLLVIAGSLQRRKGHQILFEALKKLPAEIVLAVAGAGEMEAGYRKTVSDFTLEDRVRFLGQREDIPAILAGADLLVLPSLLDATPYVLIEALAAGLPVVASRIFGIPELVRDNQTGILIDPGNSGELAGAILRLYRDGALREGMRRASRSFFESSFRIDLSVSKTTSVYRELLASRRRKEGR